MYLRENKDDYLEEKFELIEWCQDVAKAMAWLEKNDFFHGDLAARNVLLRREDESIVAKISDFGLATYADKDYVDISRPVPFRWCAPEIIIEKNPMNLASDCWAFGVFMWEVFSLGGEPWGLMTNQYIAEVISDERMSKPRKCHDEIYELMLDCWTLDPNGRPSFRTIRKRLNDINDMYDPDGDTSSESDSESD